MSTIPALALDREYCFQLIHRDSARKSPAFVATIQELFDKVPEEHREEQYVSFLFDVAHAAENPDESPLDMVMTTPTFTVKALSQLFISNEGEGNV